jgi:UDP-N-acetylmuramoyl-tripeptide--D-alanyl-D-alanine ligase
VTAVEVQSRAGELSFVIEGTKFRVPIWGRHPLHAALAACGVGQIAGLELTEIAEQLRRFQPPARRGEVVRLDGITVIDDTYDCRAISMPAALEILRELDELGRRIVVCGELAETEDAFRLHRDMGQAIVTACGADWLVACGRYGRLMVDAAREAGMPNRRAVWCQRPEDAEQLLNGLIQSGDVVLVRGGRGMAMDQVVSRLVRARLATAA